MHTQATKNYDRGKLIFVLANFSANFSELFSVKKFQDMSSEANELKFEIDLNG